MRTAILVAVFISVCGAFDDKFLSENKSENVTLEVRDFFTELDHFKPQNDQTIIFKYTLNRKYYNESGPLFFFIDDGGTTPGTEWLTSGLIADLAKELGGALITADHRYFGKNLPTKNASFENLQYLSFDQSLADIAYLIVQVKEHLNGSDSKVVLWGSGYGGTLAALAKEKYPHLIDGAWSSSGVFQLAPRTTETQLYLSQVIRDIDSKCADRIKTTFKGIDKKLDDEEGLELQKIFNLCSPVDTSSDLNAAAFTDVLFGWIADYINAKHLDGIKSFCKELQTESDSVQSLGNWINHAYGNTSCRNITYQRKIDVGSTEQWNELGTNLGLRQWYYYKCTQFGLFEISNTNVNETLFGQRIPETYHYYSCKDIFGPNYDYAALYDAIDDFEIIYGNKDSYETTNVIFTNGVLDRWNPHAITNLIHNNESVVMNIQNYARSADLTSINTKNDSEELTNVKKEIRSWLLEWTNPEEPEPYNN